LQLQLQHRDLAFIHSNLLITLMSRILLRR
jgi:hypothetical protein